MEIIDTLVEAVKQEKMRRRAVLYQHVNYYVHKYTQIYGGLRPDTPIVEFGPEYILASYRTWGPPDAIRLSWGVLENRETCDDAICQFLQLMCREWFGNPKVKFKIETEEEAKQQLAMTADPE